MMNIFRSDTDSLGRGRFHSHDTYQSAAVTYCCFCLLGS